MYLFISSTFVDLRAERQKVGEVLRQGETLAWGMEVFVSEPHRPLDVCLNELDRCDGVILLIGTKAGSLVPTGAGLTYTEAEIQRARERRLPIFPFVKRVDGRIPNEHDADDPLHAKLEAFRASLAEFSTPAYFDSLDQLGSAVAVAVSRWERQGRPGARRLLVDRDTYFSVEAQPGRFLRHDVQLQGRMAELGLLTEFVQGPQSVLVLSAEGGAGKSKLLHDWTHTLSGRSVLFVKPGAVWHGEASRELPVGDVLIVFDDAHQQSDLVRPLLLLVAESRHQGQHAQLLIATRPSGIESVRSALSQGASITDVLHLELRRLSLADRRAIAEAVLGQRLAHLRDHLVEVAGESPLVLVVGGRLIADAGVDPVQLLAAPDFRHEVLDRFIAELGPSADSWRPLLDLLALLGPVHVGSDTFLTPAGQLLGLPRDEVLRGLRVLEQRGLAVQRSQRTRILPDALADRLIRIVAADDWGRSTGYIERVLESFGLSYLDNLLSSCAELAWRIRIETGRPTQVLDPTWSNLTENFLADRWSRHQILQAVRRAAGFQPSQALQFAKAVAGVELDSWDQDHVSEIIRSAAYDPRHRAEAVRLLWERAKADGRPQHSHSSHAGRLLRELAAYGLYKPVDFNLSILELAKDLVCLEGSFDGSFSPLDIADEALEREGEHIEGTDDGISIGAFALNHTVIRPVRDLALQIVSSALHDDRPDAQSRAVKSISRLLHGFSPRVGRIASDDERAWQDTERMRVLDIVEDRLQAAPSAILHFALCHELESALAWLTDPIHQRARHLLDAFPLADEARLLSAVCVPYWKEPGLLEYAEEQRRNDERLAGAIELIRRESAAGSTAVERVESLVGTARTFGLLEHEAAARFYDRLCEAPEFLAALLDRGVRAPESESGAFFNVALLALDRVDAEMFRTVAGQCLESHQANLVQAAAHAVGVRQIVSPTSQDLQLLFAAQRMARGQLRKWNLRSIGRIGADHQHLRDEVIAGVVGIECTSDADADGVCWALKELQPWLTASDVELVLTHLVQVPELNNHYVGTFLEWCSDEHPEQLVRFLLGRLREQHQKDKAGEYRYQASPDHLRRRDLSGIQNAESYDTVLRTIRDTLKDETTSSRAAVDLFWRIAAPEGPALVVLDEWLHAGTTEIGLLPTLIRWAPEPIATMAPYFGIHATNAASAAGIGEEVVGAFVMNAMPHQWSSKPGEVPPIFTERANSAEDLYRQWAGLPGADLFRQIADALRQSGRDHAADGIDR